MSEKVPVPKPSLLKRWMTWLLAIFVVTDDVAYSATEFVGKARSSSRRVRIERLTLFFWASLIILFGVSVYMLNIRDTLFNVNAVTEKVTINPSRFARFADWRLDQAQIDPRCEDDLTTVSGTLKFSNKTVIEVARFRNNAVQVALLTDDDTSAGHVNGDDGSFTELGACTFITVDPSKVGAITWLVDGEISLGDELSEGVGPLRLLTSGSVSIADKAALSGDYYLSEPHALNTGDVFHIANPTTQSSGLIYVNDEPGLTVTYSGKGARGIIQRYKSEAIPLENNIWVKLFNDDTLVFLWLSLVGLYTLVKLIIRMSLD